MNVQPMLRIAPLLLFVGLLAGCQTAYYTAMEKFGYEKRDLLKSAVVAARDEQKDAGVEFKDALTRLREMYVLSDAKLAGAYDKLKSDYQNCDSAAKAVRERIAKMDRIANDLFSEWEKEIKEISTPNLASDSRQKLFDTRTRYSSLASSLRSAEATMEPVLRQFKDHVLYLKHDLNAQAIASLKGEATSIQNEIARLIEQMNVSIKQADDFIKTMP